MASILILGAKSDIAHAVAHKFARSGHDIVLAARGVSEIEADAMDLQMRYGIKAETVEFDAGDYEKHRDFYRGLPERPIGVVCAVGYLGNQKVAEKRLEEARKIIDTNFTNCVSVLNIIADDFEARKEGFIIGISSVAGDRGRQSNYFYGAAKAAFATYLSGLRNRLFKSGVHVITVKPGYVRTRMTEGLDLPERLVVNPDDVAEDIFKAWAGKKDIIYTGWFWKYIMMVISAIPERIFKRTRL